MDFKYMNDEQIIQYIASNLEKMRLSKQISADDMAQKGGYNSQVYSNFKNKNVNIKIETLIKMFRGIDELDKLQNAFEYKEPYSPTKSNKPLAKRVRKKKDEEPSGIHWGDEE